MIRLPHPAASALNPTLRTMGPTYRMCISIWVLCFASMAFGAPDDGTPTPSRGEPVRSMSFPQKWKPYFGALVDWNREPDTSSVGGEVLLGTHWAITGPAIDFFGLNGEAYLGLIDSEADGGARLSAALAPFSLRFGADYSSRSESLDFIMTATFHVRRGGVFGHGTRLRVDWLPSRNQSFNFGLEIPIGQPWVGMTRPKSDHVSLPKPTKVAQDAFAPSDQLQQALDDFQHAAKWINRYATVYTDQKAGSHEGEVDAYGQYLNELLQHIDSKNDVFPDGHTYAAEVDVYHDRMSDAFALALDGEGPAQPTSDAELVTAKAKRILFDEVLAPYNRYLGQVKANDSLHGYGSRARRVFSDWAYSSDAVPPTSIGALQYVLQAVLDSWEQARQESRDNWRDSRLVWIPLRFVFTADQLDTQGEIDDIIQSIIKTNFTKGNDLAWVKNELFQGAVSRMILDAEDYHVLWIHDIRGNNDDGNPDAVAYLQTSKAYLAALIDRVRRYDTAGTIPTYMIFLDEWYYTANKSILWLKLLQNPLQHEVKLPDAYKDWEDELAAAQDSLRTAVAQSERLQAGLQEYGDKWLENLITVHINITNPGDWSFRSKHIMSIPFIPDMVMRDHRKISFRDITELDPGRGEGAYTGMGIGEHYTGPTWDDRAALVRGPALVDLKTACRNLVLSQGFAPEEVPRPLRQLPFPNDYEQKVQALIDQGWDVTAMQVQNSAGFAQKDATLMKAVLYDAMPPGSHLYIPDSLWNNSLWGGMLIGAALRGCTVLVVSPSVNNAPSAALPTMARSHRVMARLFVAQHKLADAFADAGGDLHVGIYDTNIDVDDVSSQIKALYESFAQNEFLRHEFPFRADSFAPASVDAAIDAAGGVHHLPGGLKGEKPKLHLKVQLFRNVPDDTWLSFLTNPIWKENYPEYMAARAEQVADPATVDPWSEGNVANRSTRILAKMYEKLTPQQQEELVLYLTAGSQNQDYRSMMEDGEALFVASRHAAMIALMDFTYIMGIATWIESAEQLDKMLPEESGFGQWLGEWMKGSI